MKETYRPLPAQLTIAKSNIDGLGLFATKDILKIMSLVFLYVSDVDFPNGYIRTPLGGFFNHSEDPNCEASIEGRYIKTKNNKNHR